jgi:spermidine synthase
MPSVKTTPASPRIQGSKTGQSPIDTTILPSESSRRAFGGVSSMLFALVLFCSGAAALVYQVLWVKQLSLVVGVEVYSVTVAVSAFFAGLALGGALFGRWVDRVARPFLLYSLVEVGIATLGILSTIALAHAAPAFAIMEARAGFVAWALPFLLVGIPALLMGGTLPIAIRSLAPGVAHLATTGGAVYAANTAGGIAGALLSSFVFLPGFGVRGSAFAAALLNLVAAATALFLDRIRNADQATSEPSEQQTLPTQARLALTLYALAGGIALGYEVVWSQSIAQFLSTRAFAFSIVLATYLVGLVVGSALYARFAKRVRDSWGVFGFLIAAAGLVALLEIAGLSLWQLKVQAGVGELIFRLTSSESARIYACFAMAALGIVFVPTVLLGAAFPAALRLIAGASRVGRDVGSMIALNTAGGVVGTLLTGFLLVPVLGLVHTLGVLAMCATALGVVAVVLGSSVRARTRWLVFVIGAVVVAVSALTPPDRLSRLLATTRGGGQLAFYEESRGGTVAVVQQGEGVNIFRRLYIQGVSNSGDAMPSLRYMRLQALLPLLIHTGEPHSALAIGFGTGITAGALLQYSPLQHAVCAELLPAVVRAGPLFRGNFDASSNPKLSVRLVDGRRELMQSSQRYDVITLEPPPPSASGTVNLYSRDFYRLAARRLQPNGLFAQWLPLATQNTEDSRSLVRSFLDVFPYASLWTTELHETLLVGSFAPIQLDVQEISRRFSQPEITSALEEVGIRTPEALLATWLTGKDGLEHFAGDARPVTDDRPRIEYAALVRRGEILRVLPELLALRTTSPLVGADDSFRTAVQGERDSLFAFYAAGIAAYAGDRQTWARSLEQAFKLDRGNPYYRSVVGN